MDDFKQMMEEQIKQQNAAFEETLAAALEQQRAMNEEMGFETTEEDRNGLIEEYRAQAQAQEAMMRSQMDMQASILAAYGGGDMAGFAAQAMAQANAFQDLYEDDEEMSDEDLQAFLEEHPVPDELKKHLMIGAVLIGTNDEPYITLALIGDKEDYRDTLEGGWGIENRSDALEMLESLLKGRHSESFKADFAVIKAHGTDGYFDNAEDPIFDEDDIENYEAALEGLVDVLELDSEVGENCTSLYAWDLDRIGLLARTLSHAGYITDEEAYDWLKKAGKKATATFGSWEDYIASILLGRALHMGLAQEPFAVAYDLLHDSKELLDTYPLASLK